jgi:hypothetical protein
VSLSEPLISVKTVPFKPKIPGGKKLSLQQAVESHTIKTSRLPHFLDNPLTDGGEVVSLTRQPTDLYR